MCSLPRHLTVRVDERTALAFHDAARAKGSTASNLLREAIRAAVAQGPANTNAATASARSA